MNRRQEVAVWAVGLGLAAIAAVHGNDDGDWLLGRFLPAMIVGSLVVFALRTRTGAPQHASASRTMNAAIFLIGLTLALGASARAVSAAEGAAAAADEAQLEADGAREFIGGHLDDVEARVDRLQESVETHILFHD